MITSAAVSAPQTQWDKPRLSASQSRNFFIEQLAAALEEYLQGAGGAEPLRIEVRADTSQHSGVRQFIVTLSTPSAPGHPETPVRAAEHKQNKGAKVCWSEDSTRPQVTPPTVGRLLPETYPLPPEPPGPPAMPFATSTDAYWAAQPPEVQELRRIEDRGAREARAWQLAAQGFTIDRDIMINLWNPYARMRSRLEAGYTWVPALGQPEIEVSPGLTFPGKKSYDPANPPPGSIIVTTAFAQGYERH